ncbi:MAG: TolC family protein [Cyclobacteriaceae bacterium]
MMLTKRLISLGVVLSLLQLGLMAQPMASLELTEAYRLVKHNYPLADNAPLIEQASALNQEIINKNRLPTLSANAEARIQSENVALMSGDPNGLNFEVPLESYKVYLGFDYKLYDGGMSAAQRQIEEASLQVNQKSLEVNLRSLKDRVNQLFFGILLARQQQTLLKTSMESINTNIEILQAGCDNGTVLQSEVSKLKVRALELSSDGARLIGDLKAYTSVLGELLGTPISPDVQLTLPVTMATSLSGNTPLSRPELDLYEQQSVLINAQKGMVDASRKPVMSLFAQGGIGYPNPLNFVDINSSTYALGGVRMGWNITDWNKSKREKEKLHVQHSQNQRSKETFVHDITSRDGEFQEKIEALNEQLKNDLRIVDLQKEILEQTEVQLTNGVINTNDYLLQVNAELSARQQYELHTVQLKQLQINYLTLIGLL